MKKYVVITASGLPVFESDHKRPCKAYIKNALERGSKPGFLSIVEGKELEA